MSAFIEGKRYFIGADEVTEKEAKKQDDINREIMQVEDPKEWLKAMEQAKFIIMM